MRAIFMVVMLAAVALAGCAEGGGTEEAMGAQAAPAAGVVRGVVVDEAVVPVEGAAVRLGTEPAMDAVTDVDGRFEFTDVPPGSWRLEVSAPGFTSAQSIVTVSDEAGGVVKVQIEHLFDQDPYVEPLQRTGYINCGYSLFLSAPCVIDYTQILPICPGGCLPILYGITGDVRRFVLPVGPGWQSMVTEIVWDPSISGTSESLSVTASFYNRTTSHTYTGASGPSPLRLQIDVDNNLTHPEWIPPEGKDDFLLFVNPSTAGSSLPFAFMLNQEFDLFRHVFYYGAPSEGWSFVAGDPSPF